MDILKGRARKRICAIIGDESFSCNCDNFKITLKNLMQSVVNEYSCGEFVCGMYPGTEQTAAELALELKNDYGVKLWGLISSEEQWIYWTEDERNRFFNIMELADYEYRTSNSQNERGRAEQIKLMFEEADVFIISCSELNTELRSRMSTAVLEGKAVFMIDPENAEISPYLGIVK